MRGTIKEIRLGRRLELTFLSDGTAVKNVYIRLGNKSVWRKSMTAPEFKELRRLAKEEPNIALKGWTMARTKDGVLCTP